MEYEKPFKSFEEQADLIIGRGMGTDRSTLIARLQDVGYYRLSGYWHIFRADETDSFQAGTTFDRVWNLYVFDRQFRLVTLDAIERIEIYLRTQLAYLLAQENGPFGFENANNLPRMKTGSYKHFMKRCREVYDRSREPFALHFRETYGDQHELPPCWILVNLMEFGMVVNLYKGASVEIRSIIASNLRVSARVLDSWLVTINTVRNICAHHGRLWNRIIGTPPAIPKDPMWHTPFNVSNERVFGTLTILSHLLEVAAPNTSWRCRLFNLLDTLDSNELRHMGFIDGWKKCPLWLPWVEQGD